MPERPGGEEHKSIWSNKFIKAAVVTAAAILGISVVVGALS